MRFRTLGVAWALSLFSCVVGCAQDGTDGIPQGNTSGLMANGGDAPFGDGGEGYSGSGGSAGAGGGGGAAGADQCANETCFDIFDCYLYFPNAATCKFTKCEGLICKP